MMMRASRFRAVINVINDGGGGARRWGKKDRTAIGVLPR